MLLFSIDDSRISASRCFTKVIDRVKESYAINYIILRRLVTRWQNHMYIKCLPVKYSKWVHQARVIRWIDRGRVQFSKKKQIKSCGWEKLRLMVMRSVIKKVTEGRKKHCSLIRLSTIRIGKRI